MFDFSILTAGVLRGALVVFTTTFLLLAVLLKTPRTILGAVKNDKCFRRHNAKAGEAGRSNGKIYFAGPALVVVLVVFAFFFMPDRLLWLGLFAAAGVTVLVGTMDEQFSLRPGVQLLWQTIIVVIAVSFGWTIRYVSDPFSSGVIRLDQLMVGPYFLPGTALAVVWLLLLMNALNWLDGVDGLATGVGTVALGTLGFISLLPAVHDAQTLLLAVLGGAALLAFFIWNWPPARIYLGTSGSWFVGLYIGLVAMAGGGKIATTLLVLIWPVADLLVVTMQRMIISQRPWQGDTLHHLHYRLQARGLSDRAISVAAITLSAVMGALAVILGTGNKLLVIVLAAIMLIIVSMKLVWPIKN